MLKDAWISNKSLGHTNAVFNIQYPWTTHTVFRLFRFQFRFRCETILGQVTDDKGKIDRYHTNINSSRLPVNGQACQPLCNMYSVIICCRNNASVSLISCCRQELYKTICEWAVQEYKKEWLQTTYSSLLWVIHTPVIYNASMMNKRSSYGHYPIRDRLHTFSQSNLTA